MQVSSALAGKLVVRLSPTRSPLINRGMEKISLGGEGEGEGGAHVYLALHPSRTAGVHEALNAVEARARALLVGGQALKQAGL